MNVFEKKIRLRTIMEDIEHIDTKIAALSVIEGIPQPDRDRLASMSYSLRRAIKLAGDVSLMNDPQNSARILEMSLDGLRARRRCEFIGAEDNNAG